MRVLFVASGNSEDFEIAPFIKSQGDSLQKEGLNLDYFTITEKGIFGYLNATIRLRRYLKSKQIDIIHAHYVLSGWIAVLSLPKQPIILSLMGSDAYGEYIGRDKIKFTSQYLILLTYLIQPFVSKIICKSKHIENTVYLKRKSIIVPNGVSLDCFKPTINNVHEELNLTQAKKYVLFLGNRKTIRKNFQLAEEAVRNLQNKDVQLLAPYPVDHKAIVNYINTATVVILTSFMEGSPNIVKEAMACNKPVVATDVGDVKWLFGDEPGYFIADFTPNDFSKKIEMALEFSRKKGETRGRKRLYKLGLENTSVAKRIISVYKTVIE